MVNNCRFENPCMSKATSPAALVLVCPGKKRESALQWCETGKLLPFRRSSIKENHRQLSELLLGMLLCPEQYHAQPYEPYNLQYTKQYTDIMQRWDD